MTDRPTFASDLPRPRIGGAAVLPNASLRMVVDLSVLRPGGENGGVKPFVFEYLRELARLEGERVTFIFLTWSSSHGEVRRLARPQDEMVCVRHTEAAARADLGNWRDGELFVPNAPPDLLLRLKADVLYSPLSSPEFACPGIPLIATIVDVLHRDYPATLTHDQNVGREQVFQELIRISDRLQCISQYTADRISHHFEVPADRAFCSHIVIHQRLADAADTDRTAKGGRRYFLYPANAWRHKNHETLLVAYRLYRHRHGPDAWDLVLTGHEDERMREVLDVVGVLGLSDHVHFHGHLPDEDFSRLWVEAGALVFPSLHEGFGIPLLEAMHFGIPILSSRDGSLAEVAGDSALYADARDPDQWAAVMHQMAGDPDLRAQLVARGNERLEEFSLAAVIDEFRRIVHDTARRPSRRWIKGRHIDGWIEGMALFGIPGAAGVVRLELGLAPGPAGRRVRVYRGMVPLGGFEAPAGQAVEFTIEFERDGRPLAIEVPDASNLNPDDHRRHGVIVAKVAIVEPGGRRFDLLETPS